MKWGHRVQQFLKKAVERKISYRWSSYDLAGKGVFRSNDQPVPGTWIALGVGSLSQLPGSDIIQFLFQSSLMKSRETCKELIARWYSDIFSTTFEFCMYPMKHSKFKQMFYWLHTKC